MKYHLFGISITWTNQNDEEEVRGTEIEDRTEVLPRNRNKARHPKPAEEGIRIRCLRSQRQIRGSTRRLTTQPIQDQPSLTHENIRKVHLYGQTVKSGSFE